MEWLPLELEVERVSFGCRFEALMTTNL